MNTPAVIPKPSGKRKGMKHIFKKLHFGTNHDPRPTPDYASDRPGGGSPVVSPSSPSPPTALSAPLPETGAGKDYYSSEEEFQMQLALAISASSSSSSAPNPEFLLRDDPDYDQIRAATMLSLGGRPTGSNRLEGEDAAEALSRKYWDYNVLDYEEKIVDGFYDIYGFSTDHASQGKMPSVIDLQSSVGDHGFEVVVVNRTLDPALEELMQVAHCISLDCPVAQVSLLVQRISDLVNEHMGGSDRDANVMLARWLERSKELRSSLHTSILPIGCLNIGLSRHRALLFKVLADHVGLPCRLVKGSHYTGIEDDAVNFIKSENEREFLVDLMAAPGTLLPADVLSTKDVSLSSFNPFFGEYIGSSGKASTKRILDGKLNSETAVYRPSLPSASSSAGATYMGSSFNSLNSVDQSNLQASSSSATSSQQRANNVGFLPGDNVKAKLNKEPYSQDIVNANSLFADLNPFQMVQAGKSASANKFDNRNSNEFQKHGQTAMGPGRPPLPLIGKNRTRNEVPKTKEYEFVEGLFPKNNPIAGPTNCPSTSTSSYTGQIDDLSRVDIHESSRISSGGRNTNFQNTGDQGDWIVVEAAESSGAYGLQEGENVNKRRDRRKFIHDRFMENSVASKENPSLLINPSSKRFDPMLDDVGEWEIPWEDLVIGDRIGLGSYGEVYHADWNGTEVAVKKFLDQDFSGDALDEFRREVRIMRRLRHPNVVLFMGAVTRPPNLSIVTEFLPRGSLYRIVHRPHFQLDEKRRIKMALDVAMGMNCLHTSIPTIVHRDLKSPNLLVDQNWNVKVCDFGLSRLKHNTFLSSKSTAGTPEWMAPEVLRNEPSNEKCDVYSFGVILWELATLRMPWSGMNPMQVVGAVGFQNKRLDIPNEVDPLVARIIWECWQTEPNLRPSFAQLTTALKPLQKLVIPNQQLLNVQSPSLPQEISVNSTP